MTAGAETGAIEVYDELTEIDRRRVFRFTRDGREFVAVMTEMPQARHSLPGYQLEFEGRKGFCLGAIDPGDFEIHSTMVKAACAGVTPRFHTRISQGFKDVATTISLAGATYPQAGGWDP